MCHVMWDWMVSSVGDRCADRKEGCLHLRLPVPLCDSLLVLVLLFSFFLSLFSSSLSPRACLSLVSLTFFFIYFISFCWTVCPGFEKSTSTSCLLWKPFFISCISTFFFTWSNSFQNSSEIFLGTSLIEDFNYSHLSAVNPKLYPAAN